MKVKICGITNLADAMAAVDFGADALGFILAPESPRCVSAPVVADIIKKLPPFITTVAVITTGNGAAIHKTMHGLSLHLIQFHGHFTEAVLKKFSHRAIHVLRVKEEADFSTLSQVPRRALLLDTYHEKLAGGSGLVFDWSIAKKAKAYGNIVLAGGLTPNNIQQAIGEAQPYGVDVSSGVEASVGKKDLQKLKDFIQRAKEMTLMENTIETTG